jgi:hypothetical protein
MNLRKRVFGASVLGAATAVLGLAGTAWADPPSNDTFSGATPISSVPFSTTENTTQATVDTADTAAEQACNASTSTFSNSVWFSYTPSADQTLQLDTSQSSYPLAGAILTGSPASFTAVSCFFGSTSFHVTQGTTYYVGLSESPAGSGGTLNVSIAPLTPPNAVLTIDSSGEFDSISGAGTVRGTASCTGGAFAFLYGTLSTKPHGRNAGITGSGSPLNQIVCDGSAHPWSLVATPFSGLFKGGPATADVNMFACSFTCQAQQITQTITLKH